MIKSGYVGMCVCVCVCEYKMFSMKDEMLLMKCEKNRIKLFVCPCVVL